MSNRAAGKPGLRCLFGYGTLSEVYQVNITNSGSNLPRIKRQINLTREPYKDGRGATMIRRQLALLGRFLQETLRGRTPLSKQGADE
ncbi:hypothetical protein PGTUg99_010287 [Puccinia graminis f. sp. tritici]|uniref:Uncharacterized protein n=1 Tax=Puccinia graminis f. sp. tritici TaxID=56615 RepID=A0A5B0SJL5_PUCGR|nr:hypothetical protein PGTUg99_010287 [Puccinia graminis f. sp. tritici]